MYYNVNESKEYRAIPQAYTFSDGSTTGNFADMTPEEQKAEGFYPIEEVRPEHDPRIERLEFKEYKTLTDKVQKVFEKVSIDIEVLRNKKLKAIENHKNSLLNNSLFEYNNKIWVFNSEASANASELDAFVVKAGQFPSPFSWTDADGNEVPMDQTYFNAFSIALGTRKLTIIGVAKTHTAQVNALTDALEIFNYDFSTGWGNYVPPVEDDPLI